MQLNPSMAGSALSAADKDALRRSAVHKNAWRMLPLLVLAFIFNYIDRTSVGFAAITMNKDLGFTATQFGWGAGILFAGYCFFEIPSNLALYRFGARRWLARIMISWGLAASATAFVEGPASFYAFRFLLGVAEAGFFPGVTYLLALWFPAQYRARMLAFFMLGVPLSSVIGGPMSAYLLGLDGLWGLAGWKWMFVVQGLPAVLIGIAVLMLLRDHPSEAEWLSDDERRELIAMLEEEPRHKPKKAVWAALTDRRVLLLAAIQFGFVLGSYGIGMWLPLILKGRGFTTVEVGYLSTIPYLAAIVGMIVWAKVVDRTGRNVLNLACACLLGAIGLYASTLSNTFALEMAGISVAVLAVSSARAIFWSIPTGFLTGAAAAGGLAFINSIGTMGGFVGPYLMGVLKESTGSFTAGMWTMAAILVVSALLTACMGMIAKKD